MQNHNYCTAQPAFVTTVRRKNIHSVFSPIHDGFPVSRPVSCFLPLASSVFLFLFRSYSPVLCFLFRSFDFFSGLPILLKSKSPLCYNRNVPGQSTLLCSASAEVLKWSKRRHSKCFRPVPGARVRIPPLRTKSLHTVYSVRRLFFV